MFNFFRKKLPKFKIDFIDELYSENRYEILRLNEYRRYERVARRKTLQEALAFCDTHKNLPIDIW